MDRRPPPDVVVTHLGPVGVIPWSLRMTGLDVDSGDYRNLERAYPPATGYPTPRGQHLYYGDVEGRGNRKFKAHGCSGDIRGANGYAVLHGEAMLRLWGAVTQQLPPQFPFPVQLMLFEDKDLGPTQAKAVSDSRERKHTKREWGALADKAAAGLYTAVEGTRHDSHFDALRYWAYSVNTGGDWSQWQLRLMEVSDALQARIPIVDSGAAYSLTESRTNAASVASFVWSGRAYLRRDTSSEAQRRRILKRWHGSGSFMQELEHKAMLGAIRIDFGRGLTAKEISQNSIYSPRHIFRIVEAERAAKMGQRNDSIRAHVAGGSSVMATAAAFGLSRQHVYNVLKSVK